MSKGDKFGGIVSLGCLFVVCATLSCSEAGRRREYFKPPSSCLTGPSCQLCQETVKFFNQEVCCYHCRLDNVVINKDLCHCINTGVVDPDLRDGKVRGNCSMGKLCENCAVKMSSDASLGARATPGILSLCCQDCGIVAPYFHRDGQGCHCVGDPQGRVHQVAPRYDPSLDPTTTTTPPVETTMSSNSAAFSWSRCCLWCQRSFPSFLVLCWLLLSCTVYRRI